MTNICKRPAVQKGQRLTKKPNRPNIDQLKRWARLIELGCILSHLGATNCRGRPTIEHNDTGMGRRKDHDDVCCLCLYHHTGAEGIDGKVISVPKWHEKYATLAVIRAKTKQLLGEP